MMSTKRRASPCPFGSSSRESTDPRMAVSVVFSARATHWPRSPAGSARCVCSPRWCATRPAMSWSSLTTRILCEPKAVLISRRLQPIVLSACVPGARGVRTGTSPAPSRQDAGAVSAHRRDRIAETWRPSDGLLPCRPRLRFVAGALSATNAVSSVRSSPIYNASEGSHPRPSRSQRTARPLSQSTSGRSSYNSLPPSRRRVGCAC